ncbi:TPA: oxaloacetate decarboxylase subunit gamma [Mannheimia haemolytica]|uniref:Probable oxaloacetate decarboxylase gamma chain n=2 Tax=Mannheimia haemolytica TaxID=75985 RepID=A0A249A1X1_MANHA|nr:MULTISPECIES: oxaloacetate decarboxylase subunit gamma [Mannheimia]AWW72282.1 oxaloacetate decarboxylase subunit gamma [Pasteurellaceae bacterium 12565]AGI33583.1 oxaloacetate decarboxylase gamma chain [Mannheimia haemolytica USDA-ARS-USMARC-183]AGI34504.1 oxaloacetate decarboxylase gamma chain [Mannheimia haemolytica USDA-ARS-USMARC-185]AGK01503.1 oxaloacetate decarboxylase gamma subunit OadG [Mannheimia haemolytica M42548]AGQ26329.1 oxaloacetate decarboxylase subunit gamma [Mannheimia hae
MAPAELFAEGINLMVAGMGFVMLFLLVLIYAISFISKIINQYFPEPVSIPASKTVPQSPPDDLERLRPVIAAAIAHHRRINGQH